MVGIIPHANRVLRAQTAIDDWVLQTELQIQSSLRTPGAISRFISRYDNYGVLQLFRFFVCLQFSTMKLPNCPFLLGSNAAVIQRLKIAVPAGCETSSTVHPGRDPRVDVARSNRARVQLRLILGGLSWIGKAQGFPSKVIQPSATTC